MLSQRTSRECLHGVCRCDALTCVNSNVRKQVTSVKSCRLERVQVDRQYSILFLSQDKFFLVAVENLALMEFANVLLLQIAAENGSSRQVWVVR